MKILFACLVLAVTTFLPKDAADPLPIGSSIPKADTKMKDVSGKIMSLSDIRTQNGLLVIFSCQYLSICCKNQQRSREMGHFLPRKILVSQCSIPMKDIAAAMILIRLCSSMRKVSLTNGLTW